MSQFLLAFCLALGGSPITSAADPSTWLQREVYRKMVERAAKAGESPSTGSRSHVESCQ